MYVNININNNICDHYSRAETNQGRKLFKDGNYSRKYGRSISQLILIELKFQDFGDCNLGIISE